MRITNPMKDAAETLIFFSFLSLSLFIMVSNLGELRRITSVSQNERTIYVEGTKILTYPVTPSGNMILINRLF